MLAFTRARVRPGGRCFVSSLYLMRPDGSGLRRIVGDAEAPAGFVSAMGCDGYEP